MTHLPSRISDCHGPLFSSTHPLTVDREGKEVVVSNRQLVRGYFSLG